ncbi:MAG TPA: hypothetical protein VIL52_00580 [Bacteroidota bacterium]
MEIIKKDKEWSMLEDEPCRVSNFIPSASVKNGEVISSNNTEPYAEVMLESKKLSRQTKGYITHKIDFLHLWSAFKERGVGQNEEVVVLWSKKQLKNYAKIFSLFMPKLWVMICPKGAFELMSDSNWKPELSGEARWNAQKPIVEWKPAVIS